MGILSDLLFVLIAASFAIFWRSRAAKARRIRKAQELVAENARLKALLVEATEAVKKAHQQQTQRAGKLLSFPTRTTSTSPASYSALHRD